MKHNIIKRYKTYCQGDFYSYTALCSCGKAFGDWTPERVEELVNKHLKENSKQ